MIFSVIVNECHNVVCLTICMLCAVELIVAVVA